MPRLGPWWRRGGPWALAVAVACAAFPPAALAENGVVAQAPGAPEIASPSAVLMDAGSGEILYAKNPHEKRNPASVTKLMTLAVLYDAVAAGEVHWDDPVTASEHAASMGGSQVFLAAGETFPLKDMTAAVAVASANDAAMALAEHVAGSEEAFVKRMQALAEKIGMKDSSFRNPHGLDADGHVMSAYDIALLSRYLVTHHPEVLEMTSTWMRPFRAPPREFILVNTNTFLKRYPGVDGLKTGWTSQAGWSVSITAVRGATRLIAVVIGAATSDQRWADVRKLLDWGFATFETVPVAQAGEVLREIPVDKGVARQVAAVTPDAVAVTVRKGQKQRVTQEVDLPARVPAPVAAGQRLGTITVKVEGKVVREAPLVAGAASPRAGYGLLFRRILEAAWPW